MLRDLYAFVATVQETIALIPAAGRATRLGVLPCSKELYPIGLQDDASGLPKVAGHFLLERLRAAGITRAYIVLRPGKWDIPTYFGDGAKFGMTLAYLMMGAPFGAPYTLDQAWPFVRHARIALGFPDILFEPFDAYTRLLVRQTQTGADVVLGLFAADRPHKSDMVELDSRDAVIRILIKPPTTKLHYSWMLAVWSPGFTAFMHDYLAAALPNQTRMRELFVGDVMQAALDAGLKIEAHRFDDGHAIDIGTPEDLRRAIGRYSI